MRKSYITTALLLFFVLTASQLFSQDSLGVNEIAPMHYSAPLDKISAGVGVGYEYGGVGANAIYYPIKNFGVFAGAGWYYVDPGYNVGVKLRIFTGAPSVTIIPYVEFMYGTNTYIYYKDNTQYNQLFKNFTFGGGIDIRPGNSKLGFLSLAVYIPLRSPDVKNYKDYINHFWGVSNANKLQWLNASIGYKFILWKNKKATMWAKSSEENF
ncbi:MAG: hypothetical protein JST47_15630 [Bacteroidetes bacterium]|nr:hypothetical protein [Bacteroidota bacterium]